VFVPARPFKPNPIFVDKVRSLSWSGALERCFSSALALLENIGFGWEGMPGTNTLAYYKHSKITTVKSFIAMGISVDDNAIKLYFLTVNF
jgi:hypothetical protein